VGAILTEYDPTQRVFFFTAIKDTLDGTTLNTFPERRDKNPNLRPEEQINGEYPCGCSEI
jgi:hypothetical protein